MFQRVRSRLSYANVVATLALFLAVGGGLASAGGGPGTLVEGQTAHDASCDFDALTPCLGVAMALPREGRVLLVAGGGQFNSSHNKPAIARCKFLVDGNTTSIPGGDAHVVRPGTEVSNPYYAGVNNGFGITAVTEPLNTNQHTFELGCQEKKGGDYGDARLGRTTISAVFIG